AVEQDLAARRGSLVEASRRWRRCNETQLIGEQCWQLRRHPIGLLRDVHTDAVVAEAAVAPHLRHAHIAVPIRNWTVAGVRLESDTLQSKRRRNDHRYRF